MCCSVATSAKSLQSCPTLCNPRDGSPPGSPVPGILQARTLERAAISFSNAWKWKVKEVSQSCPTICNPIDCSLPGSSIHEIFQARVLEWGAIANYPDGNFRENKPLDGLICLWSPSQVRLWLAGVPNLWDLMPDDLWENWYNNRNKVHNKNNALKSFWNHPTTPGSWKNCLPQNMSLVPKKLGTTGLKSLDS